MPKAWCLVALSAVVQLGCSFDWDTFDPRGGAVTAASAGGSGGSGGIGGSGGSGTGGVGGGGGAGGQPPCVLPLNDDFSMMQDAVWNFWTNGTGCTSDAGGGELALVCNADPNSRQAGVSSVTRFDFTGCSVHVQVVEHAMMPGVNYTFVVASDEGDLAGFSANENSLDMDFDVTGSSNSATTGLDTFSHAWWRLSERNGCITYDTSPNGITWTTLHESCGRATWSDHRVILSMTAFAQPNGVEVRFDNVNVDPP